MDPTYRQIGGSSVSSQVPLLLQSGSPGQSASSQPRPCQPLLHVHVADALAHPPEVCIVIFI
jgi:hypothetical protein